MNKRKGTFFDGRLVGLNYETQSLTGQTNSKGEFEYYDGETVTFYAGKIFLGSCVGKGIITPADMVPECNGDIKRISHYQVTNISRFVLTLGELTDKTKEILNDYRYKMNFVMSPNAFSNFQPVKEIFERLGRKLISEHEARNVLRRIMNGIWKEFDVRIPTRDGSYVYADIYRPLKDGKYPVLMCKGAFGKSSINGTSTNENDFEIHEKAEDMYYESYGDNETKEFLQNIFFSRMGPCFGTLLPIPRLDENRKAEAPAGPPPALVPVSETFEQINSMDWVPYGYVVILIEERGIGKNPGEFKQFGKQNAEDYYDAIEWAASQPWSNGNVGLWGASYYAMTQYTVAQRKPNGLKAIVPIMGDYDSYRDYVYSGGGLFNRADNFDVATNLVEENLQNYALEHPFYSVEEYGPDAEFCSSADINKIDLPIWSVIEPGASLHGRGSSEAFINSPSKNKKLYITNEVGIHFWMYGPEIIKGFRDFFDHWLKGVDNGIMDTPNVTMHIRTGEGGYRERYEEDWPVPNTEYRKLYLDATPADLTEIGERKNLMKMAFDKPAEDVSITYNADVKRAEIETNNGVTFITEPLEEDIEIAGYIKAGFYVSSNTKDMELHISVRVLDENNMPVVYSPSTSICAYLPLGFGAMKVSHRKKDEEKSTIYRPVYTHLEEDYQPLKPGEIVECEVPTFPTTGLIRKGWRIKFDIEPVGNIWIALNEEEYRPGSTNTIYTGPKHLSYLQLPVLPKKF